MPRFAVVPVRESAKYKYEKSHITTIHDDGDFTSYLSNTNMLLDKQESINAELKQNLDEHAELLEQECSMLHNTNQNVHEMRKTAQQEISTFD